MSVTRTESGGRVAMARGDQPVERHLTAVESHDATLAGRRPSTVPAYYQGRPAGLWLDAFGRGRRSAGDDKPATARDDVPATAESVASHRPGHAA